MPNLFSRCWSWLDGGGCCSRRVQSVHEEVPAAPRLPQATEPNSGCSSPPTQDKEQDQRSNTASIPPGYEYEVFLSFRGPDTRKGFADYLYNSMTDAGIRVFRDNEELRSGDEIGPRLRQGISQSKISIPIFSKGYSSSKWCLRELAFIAECWIKQKQIVKPIFYDVTPEEVKNQTGGYGEELKQHAVDYSQFVPQWRSALSELGGLKGWVLKDIADGHEGHLVKQVVGDVLRELKKRHLPLTKALVGIEQHAEVVLGLLDVEMEPVRAIGIYGICGIGKTTLAKDVYNKLLDSSEFVGCCSLDSIREKSQQPNGLEWLQSKLVSDLMRCECQHFGSTDDGKNVIMERFREKKVLILLDDVDQAEQLNALVGVLDWFGPGSRIIVTTTDGDILRKAPQVNIYYHIETMDHEEALELFNQHAFMTCDSSSDASMAKLNPLANEIVKATGRIPLALEVIGGYLCGRSEREWEAMLNKLKEKPDKKILDKLKVSYDGLEDEYKQIFLDIACFFIGVDYRVAVHMWNDCRYFPDVGIQVLIHRSLIKIGEDNKLWMHDSLRDLGREIAREDNKPPGMRRRLWSYREARNVVQNSKGTMYIEAISLQPELYRRLESFDGEQFKDMSNLRFLRLECDNLGGDFGPLSELRWLSWQWSCADCKPISLPMESLKIIDMSCSKVTDYDWSVWSSIKKPVQLKVIDLSSCHLLSTTPDLSMFPNLDRLNLEDCIGLVNLHPSILNLQRLSSLNLKLCPNIEGLPDQLGRIEALTELIIDGTSIAELPNSICCLGNLQRLSANDCSYLQGLPSSIGQLTSLVELSLSHTAVQTLPDSGGDLSSIQVLNISSSNISRFPRTLGNLGKLEVLDASNCEKLNGEIPAEIGGLSSLRILKLDGTSIIGLPGTIGRLSCLETLHLTECKKLKNLPELPVSLVDVRTSCQLEAFPNLPDLIKLKELVCSTSISPSDPLCPPEASVGNGLKLQSLPKCLHKLRVSRDSLQILPDLSSLSKLSDLSLDNCHNLMEIPSLVTLVALKTLSVNRCPGITSLSGLEKLKSLKILRVTFCEKIKMLPDLSMLKKLSVLNARGCESLVGISGLDSLYALTDLDIGDCKSMKNLPNLSNLKLLRSLSADGCEILQRLKGLDELEELLYLQISGCKEMKELPNLSKLKKLRHLNIAGCKDIAQLRGLLELKCLERIVISRSVKLARLRDLPGVSDLNSIGWDDASVVRQIIAECHQLSAPSKASSLKTPAPERTYTPMSGLAISISRGEVIAINRYHNSRNIYSY